MFELATLIRCSLPLKRFTSAHKKEAITPVGAHPLVNSTLQDGCQICFSLSVIVDSFLSVHHDRQAEAYRTSGRPRRDAPTDYDMTRRPLN